MENSVIRGAIILIAAVLLIAAAFLSPKHRNAVLALNIVAAALYIASICVTLMDFIDGFSRRACILVIAEAFVLLFDGIAIGRNLRKN